MQHVFGQWVPNFPLPRQRPEYEFDFGDAESPELEETNSEPKRVDASGGQCHTTGDRATRAGSRRHAAIASELEQMQNRPDEALNRRRESAPRDPQAGPGTVPAGGGAATWEGAMETPTDSDVVPVEAEVGRTGAESTPSEHAHAFSSSSSLSELAKAQGVGPVEDLEGIVALWPSDDDPDELLEHLLAERAARRRATGSAADR